MTAPLAELAHVCKRFGGVRAVEEVSLDVHGGEVVALVGHNGAGKSTLVKLLSGALRPDAGEVRIGGRRVDLRSPRDARRHGIETLYQTLALADNLDAAANLFLGRELRTRFGFLDDRAMERATRDVLERLNPRFTRVGVPVRELSGGERQIVALARAIHFDARILIMDEPTAALGPEESAGIGELIARLTRDGLGVFLVSHDLHDVLDCAHRIAVMKNGRLVGVCARAEVTRDRLLELMILGR